jgi:hypothetical protein
MSDKKWRVVTKNIGNVLVDLGKLSFGSLMLGSMLKGGLDPFHIFLFGAGLAMISFVVGLWFMSMGEE